MSDARIKAIGVTVALLLHLIVAVLIAQDALMRIIFPEHEKAEVEEVATEPAMSFRFVATPQPVPSPSKKAEPKKEPAKQRPELAAKKQFHRTNPEQLQQKPKDAKFYGERDTVAQSNAAADPNAAKSPSVSGRDNGATSVASQFQDGSLKLDNLGKPSRKSPPTVTEIPTPPAITPPKKETKKSVAKSEPAKPSETPEKVVTSQMDAGKPLAGSRVPLADYLEMVKKQEIEMQSKKPIADLTVLNKGESFTDSVKKSIAQNKPKELTQPTTRSQPKPRKPRSRASKSGFRPQVEASRMVGSISRHGKNASFDVEGSPLGKYKQAVQNATAKEWYRRIGGNRDLVKPGLLQVRWYVYDDGKVRGITILQELQGSEIQKGMTIQSISKTKIPSMPKSLRRDLNGEPIEITISFQF